MPVAGRTGHSSEGFSAADRRVSVRWRCQMRQIIARALLVLSFGAVIVEAGLKW